ncbi:MAG TPA: PAS domain-containing protein, partial [Candidatus Saccharimonadales bacterium]|nr:PAS domain-containing protein [Candidatus Saccharimonadales bacterium]
VLDLVSIGHENKEIASLLGVGEQAVKQQVSLLLKKFGVASRAALTRTAVTMRLLGMVPATDTHYEYLFDRAPLLIAMTSGPEHRLILVNRAFKECFGDRPYLGEKFGTAFPAATDLLRRRLDRIYESKEPYRNNELPLAFDLPDGTPRELHVSVIAEATSNAAGVHDGIALYGWDVTEPVRARHHLERLTREQIALLEQLPVGIIYVNTEGRPIVTNAVAMRILGTTFDPTRPLAEQYGGRNLRFAASGQPLHPRDGPTARALAGWPFDDQLLVRRSDGDDVRIQVSSRPLHDDHGAIVGAVIAITDPAAPGG